MLPLSRRRPPSLRYIAAVDLKQALAVLATVEGGLVKVDRFLNHRVVPSVLADIGRRMADLIGPDTDLLLTAEASGIPPAAAASAELGIPYVYAKKYVGSGQRYTFAREVSSPTKGTEYRVEVARHLLDPGQRVAVVDDFLSQGRTAEALGEIVEESGSTVHGMFFVIEKEFVGGRSRLLAHDWPVQSLEVVTSIDQGIVHYA